MIYATDLDRTLIFSSRFLTNENMGNVVCVESKGEREISFMLKETFNQFQDLKSIEGLTIIPVTTRSLEQYKRVEVVQDSEYAITTNGGIILHNGEKFKPWEDKINAKLEYYDGEYTKILEKLEKIQVYFTSDIVKVDNIFYYVKVKEELKSMILNYLEKEIDGELWHYTIQGLKLYVIPKGVTKEDALQFLMNYIKEESLVVSGDGKLDKGFLKVGDFAIIPEKSEVLNYLYPKELVYLNVAEGLGGTSSMLNLVRNYYKTKRGKQIERV